jgi:hypothetical protein
VSVARRSSVSRPSQRSTMLRSQPVEDELVYPDLTVSPDEVVASIAGIEGRLGTRTITPILSGSFAETPVEAMLFLLSGLHLP